MMVRFYVGTHEPSWLKRTAHPLFLSRRRLSRLRRPVGRGLGPWALDSGGFSELTLFGRWETGPEQYADEAARWMEQVGGLDWAACQDWMCEPVVRHGGAMGKLRVPGTHKSVREHQELTVASYLRLRELAPTVPWAPVLQGWEPEEYPAHVEMYASAGVDLRSASAVGVGSVCRRQDTDEAASIFARLAPLGLRLHGFGLKLGALRRGLGHIHSADSMAWSLAARKRKAPLSGCSHKSCANCFHFAMRWRDDVLRIGRRPAQMVLAI